MKNSIKRSNNQIMRSFLSRLFSLLPKRHKRPIVPFSFWYYYIPVLVIALIGFGDSIYLAVSHYQIHTDVGYSSFCAVSRALNCDTVSTSQYAVFWGIPVAIWGVIGYMFIIFVLLLAGTPSARKQRVWPVFFWISLIYSIGSLILAGISTLLINSYCIMCIVTYLVNFALLYYAWFVNKRFGDAGLFRGVALDAKLLWSLRKICLTTVVGFLFLVGYLMIGLPEYWHMEPPKLKQSVSRGITEAGHPWIGAKNPELVIEEFTDYLCTQCRIKHFYLRRLVAENPNKIKLIHRHFPMDHKFNPLVRKPYHVGAGTLALFSIYAAQHGAFWEANDMFFQIKRSEHVVSGKKIAKKLDLNPREFLYAQYNRHILYHLQKDVEKGLSLGLTGTPGYVIDGKVYQGYIPPKILKNVIE